MHDLFSKEIILINSEGQSTSIFLNPDGKYDTPINPGHYKAILIDGNSGHREEREFDIVAGQTQTVWFIGHAVSSEPGILEPIPTPTIEPTTLPTEIPTTVPTITPTPTPTPDCHWERVCTPEYWSYELRKRCHAPWCDWVIVPIWHSEKCHYVWVCGYYLHMYLDTNCDIHLSGYILISCETSTTLLLDKYDTPPGD
jgi:hypothetical protein